MSSKYFIPVLLLLLCFCSLDSTFAGKKFLILIKSSLSDLHHWSFQRWVLHLKVITKSKAIIKRILYMSQKLSKTGIVKKYMFYFEK